MTVQLKYTLEKTLQTIYYIISTLGKRHNVFIPLVYFIIYIFFQTESRKTRAIFKTLIIYFLTPLQTFKNV